MYAQSRFRWPMIVLASISAAVIVALLGRTASAEPPVRVQTLAPNRWEIAGGAFAATQQRNGWELAVARTRPKGQWTTELTADLDAFPFLAFQTPELSRECAWSLTLYEARNGPGRALLQDAPHFGQFVFDLRRLPGWTGSKRFRLEFTVRGPEGRSNWILLKDPGLYSVSPFPAAPDERTQTVLNSERMNRALVTADTRLVALSLMKAPGDEWAWGGALTKVTVDTDRLPFAELDVRELSADASFRLGISAMTSGPVDRSVGTLSFNYRDAGRLQGTQEIDIQTILAGAGGRIAYAPIRFLPYPSLSAPLVTRAEAAAPEEPATANALVSGPFTIHYEPKNELFRIRRKDGTASLATRFLEMAGIPLTPAGLVKSKRASGERLTFHHTAGNLEFTVDVDSFTAVEGLLHWRVTAVSGSPTRFPSSGHELCYVPSAAQETKMLRRIMAQSWSASGLACVAAPGLGTALYFQNYTALNPVFERCRMAPRFWVSASAKTLGFPNPMDTRAVFPANAPVVLSDAWLYLTPDEDTGSPPDKTRDSARFLQGLAAIFAQLPDKPATAWLDWQKLARRSLQDMYNNECWGPWENGTYLKAYVGTVGASPQLTGMQDVIGPLLAFLNQTGEGRDMYNRLRAEVPHFWSEKRGSFLLFANDPNSNWWSLEQIVGVCRAALNGDADAKALCLKSAPALIRLARDSRYTFDNFTEYKDLQIHMREFGGIFVLYMMELYELSGDRKFVDEAAKAAEQIAAWEFSTAQMAGWSAMTCEGLARLYEATKEQRYLDLSLIPLAGLMQNAWLWQCRYGHAKGYTTFFGFNSDASGVDYITPADQHIVWYSLNEYYLRAHTALSSSTRYLVAEALRYVPQSAWYTYPLNLPLASLHQGVPFWHSKNLYELAIPVEDLNDGWRKNGSVGQELYGAGAAFEFASRAYVRVPDAGVLVFCEYPILKTEWAADRKALTVHVGGIAGQTVKFELRKDPTQPASPLGMKEAPITVSVAAEDSPRDAKSSREVAADGVLRIVVPSASRIEIGFRPAEANRQ